MKVAKSIRGVRSVCQSWRAQGEEIAFVPTMGALHAGHLSLVDRARKLAPRVATSIFVNPTQFGPGEDFDKYPRTTRSDLKAFRERGVDLCFLPTKEVMYSEDHRTKVQVTGLGKLLEGQTRPDHFAGVALVVLKLLNMVQPNILILGQKDAQQAVVVETMIRDLDLPVKLVRGPIIRDRDGLALSSRNRYLNAKQRAAAPILWKTIKEARRLVQQGERSPRRLVQKLEKQLMAEPELKLDYVVAVNALTLEPVSKLEGRILIALAAYFGKTRLIDNIEIRV
ncbi:MAG: pantoate--beta-alanine ligase [Candidatus Eisenbacteria bacterium]|uniref:Pantothenate synthetase n=1 Tax=Eiseniibacteriota bacterium TaxID=2212470 RepID=A0A7Y2ECC7_UNCEI|nr:pantoate--beta-alanine ligase [Candidatus Eisenbacteria bacterium]